MEELLELSHVQRNVLIASIMGDGEITKLYKNSRRKNNSYREHYGKQQEDYRNWKASILPEILYLTPKSQTLRSKSLLLFTKLYPHFYDSNGIKKIPANLLYLCTSFYFLAVLYLDDGSLCITKSINHNKKIIYLSPTIAFYLQCYKKDELVSLKQFIFDNFQINLSLNKRKDGHGYILKMTKTQDVYNFLSKVKGEIIGCDCMQYKIDWSFRFKFETDKLLNLYSDYQVLESNSSRWKNYDDKEIVRLIELKNKGISDKIIAQNLDRSYWSVVYKISELRKNGHL